MNRQLQNDSVSAGERWVAEIPAIPGCYALMETREAALAEFTKVFEMIAEEYREKGKSLPTDTTEIVNA
jgi:predicted RNase H-like HicB family nuclease